MSSLFLHSAEQKIDYFNYKIINDMILTAVVISFIIYDHSTITALQVVVMQCMHARFCILDNSSSREIETVCLRDAVFFLSCCITRLLLN